MLRLVESLGCRGGGCRWPRDEGAGRVDATSLLLAVPSCACQGAKENLSFDRKRNVSFPNLLTLIHSPTAWGGLKWVRRRTKNIATLAFGPSTRHTGRAALILRARCLRWARRRSHGHSWWPVWNADFGGPDGTAESNWIVCWIQRQYGLMAAAIGWLV